MGSHTRQLRRLIIVYAIVIVTTIGSVAVLKTFGNQRTAVFEQSVNIIEINSLQPVQSINIIDDGLVWRTNAELSETVVTTTVSPEVKAYLRREEEYCLKKIASINNNSSNSNSNSNGHVNWCPCLPPDLRGRIPVDMADDPDGWPGTLRRLGRDILVGGEWSPADCKPTTHLAVIIPCRDRDSHLRVMLRHLYPILQRQLSHFKVFVVEQNSPAVFNKAAMMNIGFMEAMKRFPEVNCVMFHDVDHLLEDDRSLMKCGDEPHHYAAAMDEWNYRLIYTGAFGGVVTMRPEVFRKVNGYSLQYFGWGGEDDDMGDRVRQFWPVSRPPLEVCRYSTIKHEADSSNPKNEKRHGLMYHQHEKYKNGTFDGLSDLSYQLNDLKSRPLYTWIHADLNVSHLSTYPTHVVHRYRKYYGICPTESAPQQSLDVSRATCRYLCDVQRRRPCVAFSHRSLTSWDYDPPGGGSGSTGPVRGLNDSTAVSESVRKRCVLHSTMCDETSMLRVPGAETFVKGPAVSGQSQGQGPVVNAS